MHPWRQDDAWGGRHSWSTGHPWRTSGSTLALGLLTAGAGLLGALALLLWHVVRRVGLLLLVLLVLAFLVYLVVFGLQHGYITPARHG